MARAMIYGFLFVILCVAIPGVIGLFHNADNSQTEVERTVENVNRNEKSILPPDKSGNEDPGITTTDGPTTNMEELAFTREEVVEAVLDEFTLTELLSLYTKVKNGLAEEDKQELFAMLEERFSDDEIEALKVFGFSELEKVLQ